MAEAMISGLIDSGQGPAAQICVSEPRAARRRELKRRFKVAVLSDNRKLVAQNEVIVLAIKPQAMADVLGEIRPEITNNHLFLSIAAGIDTGFLHRYLGKNTRIIRAMPNTPALIRQGITGLYARKGTRQLDLKLAKDLFACVGETITFNKESELDWVTALSGSGPAYVFFFLESLIDVAALGGLSKEKAKQLALATAQGAVALARRQKTDLKTLRERVTSKGGTTEAALKVLKGKKWSQTLKQAVAAAAKRAGHLRRGGEG